MLTVLHVLDGGQKTEMGPRSDNRGYEDPPTVVEFTYKSFNGPTVR